MSDNDHPNGTPAEPSQRLETPVAAAPADAGPSPALPGDTLTSAPPASIVVGPEQAAQASTGNTNLSTTGITKINRLIMEGFKSFAKRIDLPFDKDFNVVLGPNGSGKSNILDALCFVLGKTSAKSMRAEKTSNLIYNGGKTKNPAKQAEVSIVFDNSKQVFPTPEPEVKVTRLVRADGQSKYKINGKTRTRQEILDLLSFAKIDPDGYNIILQGDIVHFCEMPSVERRQTVEEIAGIGIYEEKKNAALNDLGKVEENLGQVGIILKERESYLKDLKKDRDHAMKFKELSDRLRTNKATLLRRQLDGKDADVRKVEEKLGGFRAKFDRLQGQVKALRDQILANRAEMQKIDQEVQQKGEQEQVSMQKGIEQLRIDIATMKTRLSAVHTELGRIAQRRDQLAKSAEELDQKATEAKAQKQDLEGRKASLQKDLAAHERKLAEFKKKHQLGDEGAGIDTQMLDLDRNAEEKQKALSQLREEQQNLLREKDKLEFQLQTIDQQIDKVHTLEKEHAGEIKSLKQKKDEFKKAVLELNQFLNNDSRLALELANGKQRLLKLSEELARLEVRNAGVQEAIAGSLAVRKVLENRQQLGDIYGTVAELGSSSKEHSFALEIAAANKINSVVVEDDKVAAKCIKYLKENRFGTATFLPLNKIRGTPVRPENKELAKEKGVIGFAIDLIQFEPKFKDVFAYVFGNTLVVQHIDIARRIGVGRIKMVTLDGDLCELSGAMVGGYHAKKSGAFKEQELSGSLEQAKEEIAMLQARVAKLQAEKTENEDRIQRLREFKANLEGDIIKTEKSLHLDTSDLEASKSYKDELKKQLAASTKKLDAIVDTISAATSELAQLKIQKQHVHEMIAELRKPTVIAELNAYEEHRKRLSEDIILITADLKNIGAQAEMTARDKESTAKILKDMETEAETFKAEGKELDAKVKEQEKGLKQQEKAQAEFQTKFKDLFTRRNRLSDEITALENKAFTVEENSRKEELQLNTLSIEEARLKAERSAITAEFEQYAGVELSEKPDEVLKKEIAECEKMRENIGSVNMRALEIYETVEKEYQGLIQKKDTLVQEKEDVVALMNEIEGKKRELFLSTLAVVKQNFVDIFSALSTKGEADLELETPEQPFDGGLNIKVRLTGNKFLDIRSLSGGEKTMTALAFIFAIQEHAPASFYVLDEVDAALDKHNSDKLAKLIKKYCDRAQYIVISHNDNVISEASTLYGVSMGDHGMSNVVSLKV